MKIKIKLNDNKKCIGCPFVEKDAFWNNPFCMIELEITGKTTRDKYFIEVNYQRPQQCINKYGR